MTELKLLTPQGSLDKIHTMSDPNLLEIFREISFFFFFSSWLFLPLGIHVVSFSALRDMLKGTVCDRREPGRHPAKLAASRWTALSDTGRGKVERGSDGERALRMTTKAGQTKY